MTAIVYIDMDDTLCDFSGAFESALRNNPGICFPQSQYGFFERLAPLPDALDSIKWLLNDSRFDPFILTAPSVCNPWSYTGKRLWVEQYLGLSFCSRLIISAHKHLLQGDYLIDDYANGKGQECFCGELIHFGSAEYPNWSSVTRYLEQHVER